MRTVVITGATSGFGQLLTQEFLLHGDRVIATGRKLTSRKEIFQNERGNFSDRLIEVDLDVTNSHERAALLRQCEKLGGVDILINNAGYGAFGALEDCSEEMIREQMETNFFGVAFLTRSLLPLIRAAKGKVFNFSSVFGFMAFPLTSLYCASKYAIEGMTEALHHELAPHGVQVCLIEPGGYRTDFSKNTSWAENSNNPGSVFFQQSQNYKKLQKKMATRPRFQDPQEVARGVLRLSHREHLPLRVPFGKDARFSSVFRKLAPESVFLMSIGQMTKRWISPQVEQ